MLEAMKSLLGGSIGSSASQQPPIQPQKKINAPQNNTATESSNANSAVELNISAKAKRIMDAIENGQLKFDGNGQIYRNMANTKNIAINNNDRIDTKNNYNNIIEGLNEESSASKKLNILIKNFIEDINKTKDDKDFNSEIFKIDKLFNQIDEVFNEKKNEDSNKPEFDNNDKKLSLYEKSKAIILFSELNRILGNVGVFFGRDLSLVKMSVTAQEEAFEMIAELSNTLGQDKINNINSNQAAHIDAIFRELEQIYSASKNNYQT